MEFMERVQKPDKKYSLMAFWFLNGELKEENLRWQIGQMVEKGVYGGFLHPRAYLKTPYLEQEWWEAISVCIDESRKKGFYPWLYDEYAWPSGTAGSTFEYGYQKPSRILSKGVSNMAKGLYVKAYQTRKLAEEAKPDKEEDKRLTVTEKQGTFYAFFCRVYPKAVDYLNPDTIKEFIRLTHEEYKKRYQTDFGNLIPGIFFDEIFMAGNPLPWTEKLPERFLSRYGYDLFLELPALITGDGEQEKKVRRDYYSLITTMYEEAFFKQISSWCEENGLKLTGHTEEFLWEHPRRQGNYFNTMRHLMIPGSDCHDYRYRYPRKITYSEPKYAVSVARAYGKERAMSEAMGGAGWNTTPELFKKGINTLAAMGINLFILHGFYYECEHQGSQADWPSSFFYQNPYWKYFKLFSQYVQRISYLNTIGRAVVRYGIFYPIELMQSHMADGIEDTTGQEISRRFHQVFDSMIEHQMDVDMIDSESILRGEIKDGKLLVGNQQLELLLLPSEFSCDKLLADKLLNWQKDGGKLVFYKTAPHDGLREPFSSCHLCEASEVPEVSASLIRPDIKITAKDPVGVVVNHRIAESTDYYFISNSTEERRDLYLEFRQKGDPVLLNIETGLKESTDYRNLPDGTMVSLTLNPNEAKYVIFESHKEEGEESSYVIPKEREEEWITGKWELLPLPFQSEETWSVDQTETELFIPVGGLVTDLQDEYQSIRICNSKNEPGCAKRHVSLWKASWITRRSSWNDQLHAADLYFRRQLSLEGNVGKAEFCIAAIDSFQFYINGNLVYEGESGGIPVTFTVEHGLRTGSNQIAVHVKNHNPLDDVYVCSTEELPKDRFISLLLQGRIKTDQGEKILVSDEHWLVNDSQEEGFTGFGEKIEAKAKEFDVQKIKNFNHTDFIHTWIPAWERGKPPLKPWGDLPLFGERTKYPVNLYYTIMIPSGTTRIYKPEVSGTAAYFLDGKEVDFKNDVMVRKSGNHMHHLTIKVRADKEQDGLLRPIRVLIKPFKANLGDWSKMGLSWFSGRCRYVNRFQAETNGWQYKLDLGKANFCAEIWINHKLAAVRIWSPYCADITEFIKDGENEIAVVVSNLAGNERRHMLVDEGAALGWNRYWNEDNMDRDSQNYVSGLLGPVRLLKHK